MAKRKPCPSDMQKQVNFRVTDAEWKKLAERSQRAGLSLPAYCKKAALRQKVAEPPFDRETVRKRSAEMAHAWANLNQIAKKLNQGEAVADGELARIRAVLESEWGAVVMGEKPTMEARPDVPKVAERSERDEPPKVAKAVETVERPKEARPTVCALCGEKLKPFHGDYGDFMSCPNRKRKGDGHTIYRME